VASSANRGPLTVPVWYQYESGGQPWFLTPAASRKAQLINRAGRFTLMVQRLHPTVRYVSVEGPVAQTIPSTDELLHEIAARYLPPEAVQPYVELAKADHGEQVVIVMRPERWLSSDLGLTYRRHAGGYGQTHPRGGASPRRLRAWWSPVWGDDRVPVSGSGVPPWLLVGINPRWRVEVG